jgi:hypothetical protein
MENRHLYWILTGPSFAVQTHLPCRQAVYRYTERRKTQTDVSKIDELTA